MPVDTAFLLMTDDPFVSPLLLNDVPMGLPMTVEVQVRSRSPLKSCRLRRMLLKVYLVVGSDRLQSAPQPSRL